jgi:hypothetical protein
VAQVSYVDGVRSFGAESSVCITAENFSPEVWCLIKPEDNFALP